MSSKLDSSSLFSFSSKNCAQEQEVHDLLEFLKLEYKKNLQYGILVNILEEYIREDDYNSPLKEKIKNTMLKHSVSQTMSLNDETPNGAVNLLGIARMNTDGLSYAETNSLQEVLKLKLDAKQNLLYKNLCKTDKDLLKNPIDQNYTLIQLPSEDKELLSSKQNLLLEQEQYLKNLIELQKVLYEIAELRVQTLPNKIELKIKSFQAQEKNNSIKSLFTEEKLRVDIFTETKFSLNAYKEFIKDVEKQQKCCQKQIQDLKDLKEKYKQVSCKQFADILTSYRQYKSSLEQRKKLYNYLS